MDDGVATALFALVLGLPLILLSGLFAGFGAAFAVFALVGSLALAFLVASWIATDQERDDTGESASSADRADEAVQDALETIRERYARGELTESEFERKTANLLQTETLEDARRNTVDDGPTALRPDDVPADTGRGEEGALDGDPECDLNR